VGTPCPAGELVAFQGLYFMELADWFVTYVSQVVDKRILCKPMPKIQSKTLYSPIDRESSLWRVKEIVRISDGLAVLDLSQGFQGNSKNPQYGRSRASSGYERESIKILFKVSFWYVVARTGLLGGKAVAVTLYFYGSLFCWPTRRRRGESSLLSLWM